MRSGSLQVGTERVGAGVAVLGGPTVVIDVGGYRIVSDPTFDPPGDYGYLTKTVGPAVSAEALGEVDLVLVSHDAHADNLDTAGKAFALAAPRVIAPPSSAVNLGPRATALAAGESSTLAGLRITAVAAQHGPSDAPRDDGGFVNCETVGFVLEPDGAPTIYVSGDNASLSLVRDVHDRFGTIGCSILHAGAAAVPNKFDGRPLSLTARRAAAAAEVLGSPDVIVAHQQGWAHFHDHADDTATAFDDAGIAERLRRPELGHWWLAGW